MPRIQAATVNEHVTRQRRAVLHAAARLFARDGYDAVGLADIAAEIGLARNSVYRYFPTKAHILQAWFDEAIDPLIDAGSAVLCGTRAPASRLASWVEVQFDFLVDPANDAMIRAALGSGELPPDVRADIGARHAGLYRPLTEFLAANGLSATEAPRYALLIAGLLRSAPDLIRSGMSRTAARRLLAGTVVRMVGFGPATRRR